MKVKLVRESLNEDIVNESSKEWTRSWKLLKWLGEQPDGATLTEIQHYIFVDLNGNSEEEFWEKGPTSGPWNPKTRRYGDVELRKTRGYWNTQLFGTDYNYGGLLHNFCEKIGKKWVLKRMPEKDELLYDPKTANRFYPWSKRRVANDDRIAQSKASFE